MISFLVAVNLSWNYLMDWKSFFSLLMILLLVPLCVHGTSRPVIGMLVQPNTDEKCFLPWGNSYLPASYVKWIEGAGARVLPIPFNCTNNKLEYYFNHIHGLFLPGGNTDITSDHSIYQQNTRFLYNLAINANLNGDSFPIWGTCLGFEQLAILASQNNDILTRVDAQDVSWPITFTKEAFLHDEFSLFSSASMSVLHSFANLPITENLHTWGITPARFYQHHLFDKNYHILSTNRDRQNIEFISIFQHRKYPIYATQFHPERNQFEWDNKEPINHSVEAIEAMQYLSNFFVQKCRNNRHIFNAHELEDELIYSQTPIRTNKVNRYYEQAYIWK